MLNKSELNKLRELSRTSRPLVVGDVVWVRDSSLEPIFKAKILELVEGYIVTPLGRARICKVLALGGVEPEVTRVFPCDITDVPIRLEPSWIVATNSENGAFGAAPGRIICNNKLVEG